MQDAVHTDVMRRLEMLAAVARRTGNAVIVTDVQQRIEWVNEGFTRLTGFASDEVLGDRPGRLLQGPHTDPASRARMSACIGREEPFDEVVLNYRKTGEQYWVRIEADPMRDGGGQLTGYIAIETDITDQRVAALRERLTKQIGDRLIGAGSLEAAAQIVVDGLVATYDVRAATVWVVDAGRPTLRFVAGAIDAPECEPWREVTSTKTFARGTDWIVGVGAPGVAWGTGAPCRKTDFWEADKNGQYSRRATAARDAGIRTVCAVPVHGPNGVVAVIEIGGSHRYPGYERLPDLLEEVGQKFGSFVARFRSQRAFQALFHHSPDALLVVDASGEVRSASARAEAIFGDVVGTPLAALLDDASALVSPDAGEAPRERRARRADGTSFVAEVTVSRTTATGAPSDIVAIRDLTERHRIEEELRRALADKVVLVQEVHHRVKNNLQVLSSLVSLQADALDDPVAHDTLRDTGNRIQSMALVHQQLYAHDDLTRIRFDDYSRSLCSALRASLAPAADLTFEGDAVEVVVERAVPAGLVLNELVTNAFKYGVSAEGRCVVRVRVLRTDEGFAFVVSDEGPGLGTTAPRQGSMGATLVRALTRQLRARHQVLVGPGTSIRVDVPREA